MILNTFHWDLLSTLEARSYLEIGVQEGNSLASVVQANLQGLRRIALCDTWGLHHGGTGRNGHEHIDTMLKEMGYDGDVLYLDGPSAEQIPLLHGQRFDLVHVDGDHTFGGALTDMLNAGPLANRRMVVHDIFFPAVADACRLYLERERTAWRTAEVSAHGTGTLVLTR
jgi:hypothetical protein